MNWNLDSKQKYCFMLDNYYWIEKLDYENQSNA